MTKAIRVATFGTLGWLAAHFFIPTDAVAQSTPVGCSHAHHPSPSFKTTVADPAEDEYDVKYVKLNLQLDNLSPYVVGDVVTRAQVVVPGMAAYVFELNSAYTIDSVKIDGQMLVHTTNNNVRTVGLPQALPQGTVFTAQVWYRGQITNVPGFFAGGIRTESSPSWGTQVTFTLSEPYASQEWWPVKQSLTDKIDSADIWVTVPDHLKAGSNGLLQQVTPVGPGRSRYEWKSRYPIDYYLISVSVAPYTDYSYYIHFPGTNDSVLYQNYIYDNPQTLPFWKSEIDSVADMLVFFSDLFGRYPFWQEKYGHCMAPLTGGMEHQTMSTQGYFTTTLSAHELAHQWFGDHVTTGSWSDIWLNEGFASYAEYLFVREFQGSTAASQYMGAVHWDVMQALDGSVFVPDTTDVNRIFNNRLSYNKGSAIVHTLRYLIDDDAVFFQILRDYMQQFGGGTARVQDFRQLAEQISGKNLEAFFDEWYYGEGYPVYSARWNQVGNEVYVELSQATTAPGSIPYFTTPLEIRLAGAGNPVFRVQPQQAIQSFTFNVSGPILQISLDPDNWIVNGINSITKDPNLVGIEHHQLTNVRVGPNPTEDDWLISGLKQPAELELADLNGRTIWKGRGDTEVRINGAGLPVGVYILKVHSDQENRSFKLIKQ